MQEAWWEWGLGGGGSLMEGSKGGKMGNVCNTLNNKKNKRILKNQAMLRQNSENVD